MIQGIRKSVFEGQPFFYRPGTTDLRTAEEVIDERCYRKQKINFDVERGEKWLDLGANVGAFALYCQIKGAWAACFEPEPSCFKLLVRNAPDFYHVRAAVTSLREWSLVFHTSGRLGNHTRGTVVPSRMKKGGKVGEVPAMHGSIFQGQWFDGVKMDIEGAEFGLLDGWLLPRCEKLVFEYHTSRDPDMGNLKRRIEALKERFEVVLYRPELDKLMAQPEAKPFCDRVIFCKGWRGKE